MTARSWQHSGYGDFPPRRFQGCPPARTQAVTASATGLYFLALLLPEPLCARITAIKQEFAERFASRHALTSPPHMTLFPPFRWPVDDLDRFECLRGFCASQPPVPVSLDGFGCFAPRVIYARPHKSPALVDLHSRLQNHLRTHLGLVDEMAARRPFSPHVTVAFRDLTPERFAQAWREFAERPLAASIVATEMTLLVHEGGRWQAGVAWPFQSAG